MQLPKLSMYISRIAGELWLAAAVHQRLNSARIFVFRSSVALFLPDSLRTWLFDEFGRVNGLAVIYDFKMEVGTG